MKKLMYYHPISISQSVIGAIILVVGFFIATHPINPFFNFIAPYSLMLSGFIAFTFAFGTSSFKVLFTKPQDSNGNIRHFFKYITLTAVLGIISSIILQFIFHFHLASNPESGQVTAIILDLPFMLLGEELISFYILLVSANLIYRQTKNQKKAEVAGIVISCIIFGLLHFSTYYNGNPLTTLAHILLIQGSARLVLNLSGLRSNSIIMPLIIHIIYDLIFLSFS